MTDEQCDRKAEATAAEYHKSNQRIYVVVDVSYDYYRFQENLFASTDEHEAQQFASGLSKRNHRRVVFTEAESKSLDRPETHHIWIEVWPRQ